MQILSKFCHNKHLTRLYDIILSSRVILPITMHKCVVIQQCYFYFLKTGSYSQKILL